MSTCVEAMHSNGTCPRKLSLFARKTICLIVGGGIQPLQMLQCAILAIPGQRTLHYSLQALTVIYLSFWLFSRSFSPSLQNFRNVGVVSKAAVNLGLRKDVLISCTGVIIPKTGELIFSEGHEFLLILFGNAAELIDGAVDGFDDVGEDGILGIVHPALGDALQGEFEDVFLDLLLVVLVSDVDALEGLLHDVRDDLALVDALESLGLLQEVLSAGVDMVLERDLLRNEELSRRELTLSRVLFLMERQSPCTDLYSICSFAVDIRFLTRTSVFSAQQVSTLVISRFSSLRQNLVRKGSRKYFFPSSQKQEYAKQNVHAQVALWANMKKSSVLAMNLSTPSPPRKISACLRAKLKCSQWGDTGSAPRRSDSDRCVSAIPEMTRLWGSLKGWTYALRVDFFNCSPSTAVLATLFWNSWTLEVQRSVNLAKVFWATAADVEKANAFVPLQSNINQLIQSSTQCLRQQSLSSQGKYRNWYQRSESSTLSAASPGRVCGDGGHVLDTSDFDTVTGNGSKGRLGSRSWGLVAVASSRSQLDVDGGNVELLESVDDVNCGLHGGVGGGLIAIRLDLHASSNSREGFPAGEIGDVDKGVVPCGEDVADGEDISGSILGSEGSVLFDLGSLFGFYLGLLFLGLLGRGNFDLCSLDFSHISNQYFINNQYFYYQLGRDPTLFALLCSPAEMLLLFFVMKLIIINWMLSTRRSAQSLLQAVRFNKVSWTTGNPYNVRWQYKWRPAYYTYLKDGYEPTRVEKPEDSPAIRPPFYSYFQDALYRVFPSLKTIYFRSERYQDPFQIVVLPSISIFFYQFWDLALGFKGLTLLPWMLFWTRIRDRTLDPDINQVHLRDIIHQNPQLGSLFKAESIHLLDYDLEYDVGLPSEKKFPQFKNRFFRFFNNDTHMTTGFFKFGDLESGATMTLHLKTMPVHGEFRYQVGEPFYFYDLRAEVVHNGKFSEVVIVDENVELKKKRPFLIII